MNSDEQIRDTAARVIHSWRIRKEMSQSALAEKLGMHQTAIAKIENGERRIDFATVVRIADILGIPWEEFNVSAPTDFDVFIQHFSKFERYAEQWISHMRAAYNSPREVEPILRDIHTFIGPARLQTSDELTRENYIDATSTVISIQKKIFETIDSMDGLSKVREIQTELETVKDFIAKLEIINSNAES